MGRRARRQRRFRRRPDSRHAFPIAPTLRGRNITAAAPDRVWPADPTCVRTAEGWPHLDVVPDLRTRRLVGRAMADHLGHDPALAALDKAVARQRQLPGPIHRAGRGVQFAAHRYRARLLARGMLCSRRRKDDCRDNAPMAGFLATLKGELVDDAEHRMREQAGADLFHRIEGVHNERRLRTAPGCMTPEQKAAAFASAACAAQPCPRRRGRPNRCADPPIGHKLP